MNRICAALVALAVFSGLAAPDRPAIAGAEPVILTIEGKIGEESRIEFTRSDIEALGLAAIRTSTPWHDGVQTFEGVPMTALMEKVGARGARIEVIALNKYRTSIPVGDFSRHGPILALKRNGNYMEVRDKGPLFIIYPYDAKAELKSEQYFARSAWQVRAIDVQ